MAPASARTRMKSKKVEGRKQKKKSMVYDATPTPTTSSGTGELKGENDQNEEDICSSVCSTPKGKKFRIPEVLTCPPAPKKRRVTITSCSSKRSPIAFFASPDIELFFFSAIKSVPASSFTPSGV